MTLATAGTRQHWLLRDGAIDLDRPVLMGILNVTPDSFSDGGSFRSVDEALDRARLMVDEGAEILDIGGESTRPGAEPVDEASEKARVLPVIRAIKRHLSVPVSIDTRRAAVARAAIDEGAAIVNDVSALADPAMAAVVSGAGVGIVLMHMRGTPATMQNGPRYDNVVEEVADELGARLAAAERAGIDPDRIVLDPGIGFGKTADHNIALIAGLERIGRWGRPLLLGVSRKAFLGTLVGGAPPGERVSATAAACVWGLMRGARIFRVHDVRPVREALLVADAFRRAPAPTS